MPNQPQKIIIWVFGFVLLAERAAATAIVHPKCLYEPVFNEKFRANLQQNSLRRVFREGRLLGMGNYGSVHQIDWLQNNQVRALAVKQIVIADEADEAALQKELDLLFRLANDPYVVQVYGCVESRIFFSGHNSGFQRVVYIITEKLGSDLDDRSGPGSLAALFRRKFSNERRLRVILNLARALQSIHRRNVVHSDLKPGNILSTDDQISNIKLVDFGFSNEAGMGIIGATDLFAPPEFEDKAVVELKPSFDVYSFAVTVGALEGPSKNIERKIGHVWDIVQQKYRHKLIKQVVLQHMFFGYRDKPKLQNGDHIISVINDCLSLDPGDRPTADRIVERIEAIVEDKRVYYIQPVKAKKPVQRKEAPVSQVIVEEIFLNELKEASKEVQQNLGVAKTRPKAPKLDLKLLLGNTDLAEHPLMYKMTPKEPTLNTNFGLQPQPSVLKKPTNPKISMHIDNELELAAHPGEDRRIWQSKEGSDDSSDWSIVAIFFIAVGLLLFVGGAFLLTQ